MLVQISYLAVKYGVDIGGEILRVIPPELRDASLLDEWPCGRTTSGQNDCSVLDGRRRLRTVNRADLIMLDRTVK
jgi:hypothetical protein